MKRVDKLNREVLRFLAGFIFLASCSGDDSPTATTADLQASKVDDAFLALPIRQGGLPMTSRPVPHQQLDQNAPVPMQNALKDFIRGLPGITIASTGTSLAGSEGWFIDPELARTEPPRGVNGIGEFGHSHRPEDGSLHLFLPASYAEVVIGKRWGEPHASTQQIAGPGSAYVLVFGPRDQHELDAIWMIVQASYAFASGQID